MWFRRCVPWNALTRCTFQEKINTETCFLAEMGPRSCCCVGGVRGGGGAEEGSDGATTVGKELQPYGDGAECTPRSRGFLRTDTARFCRTDALTAVTVKWSTFITSINTNATQEIPNLLEEAQDGCVVRSDLRWTSTTMQPPGGRTSLPKRIGPRTIREKRRETWNRISYICIEGNNAN